MKNAGLIFAVFILIVLLSKSTRKTTPLAARLQQSVDLAHNAPNRDDALFNVGFALGVLEAGDATSDEAVATRKALHRRLVTL